MMHAAFFVILAVAPALAAVPAQSGPKPNILFCLADDVSYPHMGAYGCTWVKTPGFDRVAAGIEVYGSTVHGLLGVDGVVVGLQDAVDPEPGAVDALQLEGIVGGTVDV